VQAVVFFDFEGTESEFYVDIGRKMKHCRKEMGLTKGQMANALDMGFYSYRSYEYGKRQISFFDWNRMKMLYNNYLREDRMLKRLSDFKTSTIDDQYLFLLDLEPCEREPFLDSLTPEIRRHHLILLKEGE